MENTKVKALFQVAICVSDARAVLQNWIDYFGIDKTKVIHKNFKEMHAEGKYQCNNYLEKDCEFYHELYRFNLGGVDFEIIQPLTDNPNPYTDFLKKNGGNGIHHVAMTFENREVMRAEMKELGLPILTYSSQGGKPMDKDNADVYFYDMREKFGIIVEAVEGLVGPIVNEDYGAYYKEHPFD